MALFRKVRIEPQERPKFDEKIAEWIEKEIDTVRIRVRVERKEEQKCELKIKNLIKGDILPTVSTRDKRRKAANVWTSGNRIYCVNDGNKFIQLIEDIKKEGLKSKELKLVSNFVNTITEIEKKEYNNYLEWLYYEMERQLD